MSKHKKKRFEVVSQEQAEKADAVICGPERLFLNDVRTCCAQCGATIYHRPHAPKTPPKLCMGCGFERIKNSPDDEQVTQVTPQVLQEVLAALRPQREGHA